MNVTLKIRNASDGLPDAERRLMKYSLDKAVKETEALGLSKSHILKLNDLIESGRSTVEKGMVLENFIVELFGNKYGTELAVPWSFFNSEIGKMVVMVMADVLAGEREYSAREVAEIRGGCSVQTVANNAEKWEGFKEDSSITAPWKFKESALIKHGILQKKK